MLIAMIAIIMMGSIMNTNDNLNISDNDGDDNDMVKIIVEMMKLLIL